MSWSTVPHRRLRAQTGSSLLEVLLAALLLLVISVFILPMFSNSLNSTKSGGRSTELSTLTQQSIEMITKRPVDHTDWKLGGDTCDDGDPCVKETDPDHWFWPSTGTDKIGKEKWLDETGTAAFHWKRTLTVRKYSIADVSAGTIDASGTTLDTLGHPNLFDSPLASDDDSSTFDVHFLEFRVKIEPEGSRELSGGQRQQQIVVSHLRAN